MIEERVRNLRDLKGQVTHICRDDIGEIEQRLAARHRSSSNHPDEYVDVSDYSSDQLRNWIRKHLPLNSLVTAYWPSFHEAIELTLSDFVDHYDDLWFPGVDDVAVFSISPQWILEISHEETLAIYRDGQEAPVS